MHVVVKEVTQPVHGADGSVTHRPGDRFPQDHELPEGVPYRLAVGEAADPGGGAQEPEAAAGSVDSAGRPIVNAPKADWVEYAVSAGGFGREAAESMTKADLIARFGAQQQDG